MRNAEIKGRVLGKNSDDGDGGESKNDIGFPLLNNAASPTIIASTTILNVFKFSTFSSTKLLDETIPNSSIYSNKTKMMNIERERERMI